MNSKQIEAEIEGLQVALQAHRVAMDQTLDRFVDEETPQMKKWISLTVKEMVEEKHERLALLPDEQIQAMKRRIADVTGNVGTLAATLAKINQPHYVVGENYSLPDKGATFPMQDVFRGAVSSVGNVFVEFGFITRDSGGPWKLGRDGNFRYEYGLSGSSSGAEVQYREQFYEYQKLLKKIGDKEFELKRTKATERFESL